MKKQERRTKGFLLSCLYAQIYFLISSLILLLISCSITMSVNDPDSVIRSLSLTSLYLSAFISGIAAVRLSDEGAASGAVSGIITAIVVLLLSLLPLCPSGFDSMTSVICTLLIIPVSVLGSLVGQKKKEKPSDFRKKINMKR